MDTFRTWLEGYPKPTEREIERAAEEVRFLVRTRKSMTHQLALHTVSRQTGVSTMAISSYLNPKKKEVKWRKPDLSRELEGYFGNPATRRFLASKGYLFETDEELLGFLKKGKLTKILRTPLIGTRNLTADPKDFNEKLEDRGYRDRYDAMSRELREEIKLKMSAPILLKIGGTYWGYSGDMKANLGWRETSYEVTFWLIEVPDIAPKQTSLF